MSVGTNGKAKPPNYRFFRKWCTSAGCLGQLLILWVAFLFLLPHVLTAHVSFKTSALDHYRFCALKQFSSLSPHQLSHCCASPPSSPGLALCNEVKDVLSGAELPDLKANLLLPEDVALRNLPPLKNAHKRFNFEQDRPIFSAVEEVSQGKS